MEGVHNTTFATLGWDEAEKERVRAPLAPTAKRRTGHARGAANMQGKDGSSGTHKRHTGDKGRTKRNNATSSWAGRIKWSKLVDTPWLVQCAGAAHSTAG